MDPYERDEYDNKNAEEDLDESYSPPPIDFYGVLNVSKEVPILQILTMRKKKVAIFESLNFPFPFFLRPPKKKLRIHINGYAEYFIQINI